MADSDVLGRQIALAQTNVGWLRQALQLIASIDGATYRKAPRLLAAHRVGAHLRHVIEFYECFLDGLDGVRVDYDARKRDRTLESRPKAAAARIQQLIARLETEPGLRHDGTILVRIEDAAALALPEPYVTSSIGRELQTLSSHTVHHLALIAITLGAHGHPVAPEFGMAPSTLRHQAKRRARAKQQEEAA